MDRVYDRYHWNCLIGVKLLLMRKVLYRIKKLKEERGRLSHKEDIKKGVILGIIFITSSFIFYYFNSIEKTSYSAHLFLSYLDNWDGHRNISKIIHYEYLIKTLLLTFLCIFCFKNKVNSSSYSTHLLILLLSLICSSILYLSYKLFPFIFPET